MTTKTLTYRGHTYNWLYKEQNGTDWYKRDRYTNDKYAPLYINKGYHNTLPPEMRTIHAT